MKPFVVNLLTFSIIETSIRDYSCLALPQRLGGRCRRPGTLPRFGRCYDA